ncbi:hypothetical protein [Phenylobacterium aquaticum]|uniref:hypothetical protein n=1 Tax=Phenylobacterium aquaticum TaxID=1763816 RepID=UPI0026E932D9|nr:hypothetical protein [Phenylobacterium aquaticum]
MDEDDRVEVYGRQREAALDVISDIDEGHVEHFDVSPDGERVSITHEWRAQKVGEVELLDRMISAWKQLNA